MCFGLRAKEFRVWILSEGFFRLWGLEFGDNISFFMT